MISAPTPLQTGQAPGSGTFACMGCDSRFVLDASDALPDCPECGGTIFKRCSLFETAPENVRGGTVEFSARRLNEPMEGERPGWIEETRASLPARGRFLAFEGTDGLQVVPLKRGWTRIGRSAIADVRLDDPSVSRRHALLVWEVDRPLRVLDDRSLNGVYVNGEACEWCELADADEVAIGRFRLFVLVTDSR